MWSLHGGRVNEFHNNSTFPCQHITTGRRERCSSAAATRLSLGRALIFAIIGHDKENKRERAGGAGN